MNTLATPPVSGLVSEFSAKPVAAVTDAALGLLPESRVGSLRRTKDVLVTIYAYGLLGFGVFFPFLLAAWKLLFGPVAE